jgi:type IV secretion system protein VirB9
MSRLALLAIGWAALGALPCLAAETKPCADDKRIECIDYRPNDVVHLYAEPGATLRIQLGAGEKVEGLHVSDQRTLAAEEPEAQTRMDAVAERPAGNHSASCDPNLCRSVVENFVYIMPRRELTGQPFFLQTQWCDGAGKCQPVPYAFELQAKAPPSPASAQVASLNGAGATAQDEPPHYYGVRFLYPAREAAERAREQAAKATAWRAAHPVVRRAAPRAPAQPRVDANYRYLYRGAQELKPDAVWDDGRSTFVRFNGLRRVPNVYTYLPDGTETNGFGYTSEPDASGTTLRIGKTAARWCLRDGDRAGCLYNGGPDPEGRASSTVAPVAPAAPVPPTGSVPLRSAGR